MEDFQKSLSLSYFSLSSSSSSLPIPHSSSSLSLFWSSSSFASSDKYPLSIDAELWLMAERRTQEILCVVQPAFVSEEKRKSIIGYFQRLIKGYYGIQVFPIGSVPLKTFLPDGDLDLTALSGHQNVEEDLATYICSILENDRLNSEFLVQDVQYICAQVKIVKCTVNDIPVDISFNKMEGISALCFLEMVDHIVGKDHLFKRSIILIKAWCFYESRLLGANYGLIGTYAIEILVLHIINIFHSSLCGPLAVLYKFLDYYGKFDWANYCVSITGLVPISSLPEVVAESPENDGGELLLSEEFLRHCREMFPVPMQSLEIDTFPVKHLNIVDPLKENNNLGRSVSEGCFLRTRAALSYGARRLREALMLPGEEMGMGIERFFINTLGRNGRGHRPDVQVPVHAFGSGKSEAPDLSGDYVDCYNGLLFSRWYNNYASPFPTQRSTVPSSSSSSQTQKKISRDALRWLAKFKRNIFHPRDANAPIPRLPFSRPCPAQLPAATDGMTKSRGTGTFIPEMTHQSHGETHSWLSTGDPEFSTLDLLQTHQSHGENHSWQSTGNPEFSTPDLLQTYQSHGETHSWQSTGSPDFSTPDLLQTHQSHGETHSWLSTGIPEFSTLDLLQNSPEKKNPTENPMKIDRSGNVGYLNLDLSPEHFPFLPSIKTARRVFQYSQPTVKYPQAENPSQSLPVTEIDMHECSSPTGMHSTPPEQTDTVPTMVEPKQEELCDANEEE